MCSGLASREGCQARDIQTDYFAELDGWWTHRHAVARRRGYRGSLCAVPAPDLAAADDAVGNLRGSFMFGLAIIVPIACDGLPCAAFGAIERDSAVGAL